MSVDTHRHIRILPDALANRIAAGEVVERPASVVKELMENALDAGARRIVVTIRQAGKELIQVEDDGVGMNRDDARLAVQRHATSKIAEESDLFEIRSLGFRGEALPSIASVSLFTLTSSDGSDAATRLVIEGGELIREEELAFVRGTRIEVRRLFYNTPARRKFMKADSAELSAISEIVQRIALSRPDVRIHYSHNGRELLAVQATEDLHERAAAVFGRSVYPKLYPLNAHRGDWAVQGMISVPEFTRTTPAHIHVFLNGRAIRDRLLMHAVRGAYGNMLEAKRFPVGCVMLSMPHGEVDVNVHPGKAEVRFSSSREVYRFVQDAVREALARTPGLGGSQVAPASAEMPERVSAALQAYGRRSQNQSSFPMPGGWGGAGERTQSGQAQATPTGEGCEVPLGVVGSFSALTVLAQLHKTYILVSSPRGLGIIDQHAAHERVTFERLKAAYARRAIERQMLLFPLRMDLDQRRMAAFEEFSDDIARLGFDAESFGGDSIQVRAVPQMLGKADTEAMLSELLDEFAHAGGSRSVDDRLDAVLATLACHGSVRANEPLNYEQMAALLRQMDGIDFAANCPHGRPVYVEISQSELEKRFGRIK